MPVALLLALLLGQADPAEPVAPPAPEDDAAPSTDAGEEIDAIDALLRAAETAPPPIAAPPPRSAAPTRVRPFEMPPVIPTEPVPYAWPLPDAPVTLEAYRGQYEPPKDAVQVRYDRGVLDNLRRASAIAGPLEGLWRVADPEGRALFQLALIDMDGADAEVEGAWRDLGAAGRPASGPIGWARTQGGRLEFRFQAGAAPVALTLERSRDDRWAGDLVVEGQAPRPVVMTPERP